LTQQLKTKKMTKTYLEITLTIAAEHRATAGTVYTKYKQPFLNTIPGASSKELLMREEDVQVLHGFDTVENANAYLKSELFNTDVVKELAPLLSANPDVKIYSVA
jgi:hypothetical protein